MPRNEHKKVLQQLTEAYQNVLNEEDSYRANDLRLQQVRVGSDVMWDGQRKRGIVDEVDLENGVAIVYDNDGGEHIVELDELEEIGAPEDAELPKDWMKHDWESREDSSNANVNLKDELEEIQRLADDFLAGHFEADDHDDIAKAINHVKTLLSDITDDGKYSKEPSNIGMPGAQY